jgi:diguanylate cyclase (GGDEF)-like protein
MGVRKERPAMTESYLRLAQKLGRRIALGLNGPQGLALLSGAMLAGYWFGGEGLLLVAGLAIPAGLALVSFASGPLRTGDAVDGLTGLPLRRTAVTELDKLLIQAPLNGRATACFVIEIDDYASIRRTHGGSATDEILQRVAERLKSALRDSDIVARLDLGAFAVIPAGLRTADLETAIQMAARMQAAISDPISVNATRLYVTAAVGFALPRQVAGADGAALLDAAECAVAEARQQGPGTIRAFAQVQKKCRIAPARLTEEVAEALEDGQIQAWFQPQISTDTGEVAGFEALARWVHPKHGTLAPGDFLPAIAAAGRMDRLGTVILHSALTALRDWQAEGIVVPTVGINLNEDDLRDPKLPDRVRWELDRFDLKPERLCIEILETVLTPTEDDVMTRNVVKLSEMGVGIDLDDFGTGTASIAAIRRFDVHRIKIDRSFVTRIDQDRGQQDMVAAILSMAERLGLQTLAEGVESLGEHAMLSQLGCGTVQGFGIGAPMPISATIGWMRQNADRIAESRRGRRVI